MHVFIFGAGASKGSQIESNSAPQPVSPLVNELFNEVYAGYAEQAGISPDQLRDYRIEASNARSLERWLTDKWDRVNTYPTASAKFAERAEFGQLTFYIWRLLLGVSATYTSQNAYTRLLRKLRAKMLPFGAINFNYDTLLDQALDEVFSADFQFPNDYYSNRFDVTYLKPYGSVNWMLNPQRDARNPYKDFRPMPVNSDEMYKHAARNMFNSQPIDAENFTILPVRAVERTLQVVFASDYQYPFVLVPLTTKLYTQFTGFFEFLIDNGKMLIQNARDIYLVGYRAKDDIIREMFAEVSHDTTLHVIAEADAEEIMADVRGWAPLQDGQIYKGGLAEFVDQF